jgi:pimeloyl-ACP methyl ester carboxylesterase
MEEKSKARTLLIIALVMMLGGSLLGSWINTGAGTASVTEVKINETNGYVLSAYLYTPKTASASTPAPGILMIHGLNNQKNYMANTALEMARRGYVVLSVDMTGHGFSNGGNGENGYGGVDALKYLRSLSVVDTDNIGLVGMSQGGFGPVTIAANAMPDGYRSIFYMESECTAPGSPDISPCTNLKNVAFNIGKVTELAGMVLVGKGSDVAVSPVVQPVFGINEPIQEGKIYGSIDEGTARILYQPWEDHAGSTDAPAAIANVIDWMGKTLKGGSTLPPSDQIWGWKLFGTAVALFGAFLFIFAMGSLLLKTSTFKDLVQPVPEYKGLKGINWWIGALVTTAIGPLLYVWVFQGMFFSAWIPANYLWPQSFTNIYMVWSVIVGVITIALLFFNHYVITKKQGATNENYGLATAGKGIEWNKVWKAIFMAVLILLPVYLILCFTTAVLKVDFRAWVVAMMPMNSARFSAFFGYLIPFAIYFVPMGILFAGFLRPKEGQLSLGREMAINSVVLTLGAVVWLLLFYIPIMTGADLIIKGSGMLGPMAAGMGGIYYIPLVVLWPLVACIYTYFFRKTGRVYAGVALATLFMVWYLAAFGVFAVAM